MEDLKLFFNKRIEIYNCRFGLNKSDKVIFKRWNLVQITAININNEAVICEMNRKKIEP